LRVDEVAGVLPKLVRRNRTMSLGGGGGWDWTCASGADVGSKTEGMRNAVSWNLACRGRDGVKELCMVSSMYNLRYATRI
jgi:hypothetical protein